MSSSIVLIRIPAPGSEENIKERNDQELSVSLPTVLGRGSVLRCGDTTVSRRQAYLDWDDDGVVLTSVHRNPTFVVNKDGEQQVTEGTSVLLADGDIVGLLKDRFWYKISLPSVAKGKAADKAEVTGSSASPTKASDEGTEMGDVSKGEENTSTPENCTRVEESVVAREKSMEVEKEPTQPDRDNVNDANEETSKDQKETEPKGENGTALPSPNNSTASVLTKDDLQSSVSRRKRILPAWMAKLIASSTKADTDAPGAKVKGKASTSIIAPLLHRPKRRAVKKNRNNKQDDVAQEIDCQEAQTSARTPKRKAVDSSPQKAGVQGRKNIASPLKQETKNLHIMSDSEGDVEDSETLDNETSKARTPDRGKRGQTTLVPPGVSDEESEKDTNKMSTPGHGKKQNITDEVDSGDDTSKTNAPERGKKKGTTALPPGICDEEDSEGNMSKTKTPDRAKKNLATAAPSKISDEEDSEDEASGAKIARKTPSPVKRTKAASPTKKTPRQSCQNGASCYRKNPQHRGSFAHPGDDDYKDPASDGEVSGDDDRPECEYGVDCYRKNKQHRVQYKHTRFPQPQRKAKRKARQQKLKDDSGSENEYDYDDTFLNDDSSDDYAPTDSNSDSATEPSQDVEEEDTKRMLKEGRKFVKR